MHFGVVVMFLGFAGEAFKKEEDRTLKIGETTNIGRYDVRLDDLTFEDDGQKNMITAHVTALGRGSDRALGTLKPAKWFYRKPEDQVTSEVDKLMSLQDDLYLVLGGYDVEAKTAVLQLKVNPLVNFVWLGTGFLMLGFSVAVWPERRTSERRVPRRRWMPAAAGTTTLLLGVLSLVLAFV